MMKVEFIVAFFLFANLDTVKSFDCSCKQDNVQLSGDDNTQIQSQFAGCAIDCKVQVSNYDNNYVIQYQVASVPDNMKVTITDGNGRTLSGNCGGQLCYSNTSSITIDFVHNEKPAGDVEAVAEVDVNLELNPYTTSTISTTTWSSSTSFHSNAFLSHDFKFAIIVMLALKTIINFSLN